MTPITARDLIEGARNLARHSRDEMMPSLLGSVRSAPVSDAAKKAVVREQVEARMGVVMDAYLTGAAEALKLIHGDARPEPWEKFDWETRLTELLEVYGLQRKT